MSADQIFSDTPAVDGGEILATLFFGLESRMTTCHGMKNEAQFVDTLQDEVRKLGAMDKLISDSSSIIVSEKVKAFICSLFIDDWQSKPFHQHQNHVEQRYQDVKKFTNKTLNHSGAPPELWLEAMKWVCYILNRSYNAQIDCTPLEKLTGQTPDISNMFQFMFYEKVYYATGKQLDSNKKPKFPSETGELPGYFVGFSESVGDVMSFRVLTEGNKILHRSNVRTAEDPLTKNLRAPHKDDQNDPRDRDKTQLESFAQPEVEYVKSPPRYSFDDSEIYFDLDGNPKGSKFKTFKPDELLDRSYLTPEDDQGQVYRA